VDNIQVSSDCRQRLAECYPGIWSAASSAMFLSHGEDVSV
jgi:hypothetical protein